MKVLIVSSYNAGRLAPFITEQIEALNNQNVSFDYYNILGKGLKGYLSNRKYLRNKIVSYKPDIIHAHYGLSGFLCLLANTHIPLITTFHGNDINPASTSNINRINLNRIISRITYRLGNFSIFVNKDLALRINAGSSKKSIIPCHVDLKKFYPIDKNEARKICKFSIEKSYLLFSSSFDIPVKNYQLAFKANQYLGNTEIIELKDYSRQEVNILLNACDAAILTSLNEGSPQFIKEAMACNCPIVSTDVGDVKEVFGNIDGCYISSFDPMEAAEKIKLAIEFRRKNGQTKGRERVIELGLDSEAIALKIMTVYNKILNINE